MCSYEVEEEEARRISTREENRTTNISFVSRLDLDLSENNYVIPPNHDDDDQIDRHKPSQGHELDIQIISHITVQSFFARPHIFDHLDFIPISTLPVA